MTTGGRAKRLPNFSFSCCVADEESTCPNKGYVTRYIEPGVTSTAVTSTSTCAGRRRWSTRSGLFKQQGWRHRTSTTEVSNTGLVTETGEEHLTAEASDEAFDAKLALELGAASLVLGKLTADQPPNTAGLPRPPSPISNRVSSPT